MAAIIWSNGKNVSTTKIWGFGLSHVKMNFALVWLLFKGSIIIIIIIFFLWPLYCQLVCQVSPLQCLFSNFTKEP